MAFLAAVRSECKNDGFLRVSSRSPLVGEQEGRRVSRVSGCPRCDGLRHLGEKGVWCGEHYATNIKGAGGRTERRATPRKAPVKCWSVI